VRAFDSAVSRLLDRTYRTFGQAAIYVPPSGNPISCTIIIDAADDIAGIGEMSLIGAQRKVEVRKSEVDAPVKGGEFVFDGQTLRIVAAPHVTDPLSAVWSCLCSPV